MKPTTTSVFVSPVRPQNSRSRIIYGLSGRAAGAHRQCLLAAQDGQTKRWPRLAGGRLKQIWGGRFFLVLLVIWLSCGLVSADNKVLPLTGNAKSKAIANNLKHNAKNTAQLKIPPLTGKTDVNAKTTAQLAETCTQKDSHEKAPAMVAIRPGQFEMGSPENETGRSSDEGPQHPVTLPRPFTISRCEITVGQFKQFINETSYKTTAETNGKGCYAWNAKKKQNERQKERNWNNPGFAQTDNHPVVCVSWHDAQRYIDWLSQRTGVQYHLPTEAEWEYAARAGTETARFYVDNKQCDYTNGLGQEGKSIAGPNWVLAECRDDYITTAPVASFSENQFGLFDMLGNVWEWTLDCWHGNYKKAPQDGSAWLDSEGGQCDRRVVRGGSWGDDPQDLRSADRIRGSTDGAGDDLGFRIARAL